MTRSLLGIALPDWTPGGALHCQRLVSDGSGTANLNAPSPRRPLDEALYSALL